MRLRGNVRNQTRTRPSNFYEYEWRHRRYGGEEKERRAEERRQQAALRAEGDSSGPSTHFPGSRRGQLNRSRAEEPQSKLASRSVIDVAQDGYQCQPLMGYTSPRPLEHGQHTLVDANHKKTEGVVGTCQISAESIFVDFGNHDEAVSVDPMVQAQLHKAKFDFDATAYGDNYLSLSPGDLLECIGHEQDGWISGRRWSPQRGTATGVGAVEEGWYPADFAEPWSENMHVDSRGTADLGMESSSAVAVTEKELAAATGKMYEATLLGVALYSFDGSKFGNDYMSLDVGDVVVFDGCEMDGWLLGRCINLFQHCEVLKRGWYPQGFTQLLSESPASSLAQLSAMEAQVGQHDDGLSPPSVHQTVVTPGTTHRSKAAEAMAFHEQGGTHVRFESPVVTELSSKRSATLHMNGELSRCRGDGIDSSADGVDKGSKCMARLGDLAVEELAEEPDAEQPPAQVESVHQGMAFHA